MKVITALWRIEKETDDVFNDRLNIMIKDRNISDIQVSIVDEGTILYTIVLEDRNSSQPVLENYIPDAKNE
jgi:hypothetical protein